MLKYLLKSLSYTVIRMQSTPQLALIYVTAPSKQEANTIAAALLEHKLAACVNILEGVSSVYTWEGKTNSDIETLLIIKSRASLLKRIETKVKELHSYKVPEVIGTPILGGSEDYLKWVMDNTV